QIEIAAARSELDAEAAQSTAVSARIAVEVLLGEKNPQGASVLSDSLEELATASWLRGTREPRPDFVAAEATLRKVASAATKSGRGSRVPLSQEAVASSSRESLSTLAP